MPSTTSALSLAFLASVALAAPTANRNQENAVSKTSFTVSRVKNENFTRNGHLALAKAYAKFGWSATWSTSSSGSSGSDNLAWAFPDSSSEGSNGEGSGVLSGNYGAVPTSTAVASTTLTTQTATSYENRASGTAASASYAASPAAASGSVTGEATATSEEGGAEFLCPVSIGGKTFNLVGNVGRRISTLANAQTGL